MSSQPDNETILNYEAGSTERENLEKEIRRQLSEVIEIPCIINGKEVYTKNTVTQVVPHNHSHVLANVHLAGKDEIEEARNVDIKDLPHPEKDEDRAKDPEWLVMLGICTHLGCVPLGDKGEYNGWFCPCHGSHYDTSGRIRKGPAPTNLEIPKYEFVNSNTIKIG